MGLFESIALTTRPPCLLIEADDNFRTESSDANKAEA
jgi:hypothetical protein